MEWQQNREGHKIKKNLSLYKCYLRILGKLTSYKNWLKEESKNDNITNCKLYFNKFIFIHIRDFKAGRYDLLYDSNNKPSFYRDVRKKPYNRETAKAERLNIFLHDLNYKKN